MDAAFLHTTATATPQYRSDVHATYMIMFLKYEKSDFAWLLWHYSIHIGSYWTVYVAYSNSAKEKNTEGRVCGYFQISNFSSVILYNLLSFYFCIGELFITLRLTAKSLCPSHCFWVKIKGEKCSSLLLFIYLSIHLSIFFFFYK